MKPGTKWAIAVMAALAIVCTIGVVCANLPGNRWRPSVEQVEEQPDGDCDEGDKRESKPDPDCGILWIGTPTPPGVRRTVTPTKTKGPAAQPTPSRRR